MEEQRINPTSDLTDNLSTSKSEQNTFQESLDMKAHYYLNLIFENYGQFFNKNQLEQLKELQKNQIIVVEKDDIRYKSVNGATAKVPIAHGARVYNDNMIHFYPFTVREENQKRLCEETLIHELLHYFIRPEYLNQEVIKEGNSFITEGLVDMCARDIQTKYQLYPNYNSNYGPNVLYVREALSNIPNKEDKMKLVFQGSIKDFYEKTSTREYNSVENMLASKRKTTPFDQHLSDITNLMSNDENRKESYKRFLYNYASNFESKGKAMNSIEKELQNRGIQVKQETHELTDSKKLVLKSKKNQGLIDSLLLSFLTLIWSLTLLIYVYFHIK